MIDSQRMKIMNKLLTWINNRIYRKLKKLYDSMIEKEGCANQPFWNEKTSEIKDFSYQSLSEELNDKFN